MEPRSESPHHVGGAFEGTKIHVNMRPSHFPCILMNRCAMVPFCAPGPHALTYARLTPSQGRSLSLTTDAVVRESRFGVLISIPGCLDEFIAA